MRRKDREIVGREEQLRILARANVLRIALHDPLGAPYIVPLNFGYEAAGEALTLYFHGAAEGKKLDLIRRDPRVGFEIDGDHAVVGEGLEVSFRYESLVGRGRAEILDDPAEKRRALDCILRHAAGRAPIEVPEKLLSRTAVVAIQVEEVTGKANRG